MADQQKQVFTQEDIDKNKVYAALAYLGILFFIPLVVAKESAYGKFHANQGLVLFLAAIIVGIINFVLAFIPIVGGIIGFVLSLAIFAFMIIGIVNAVNGKATPLPLIGGLNLINK